MYEIVWSVCECLRLHTRVHGMWLTSSALPTILCSVPVNAPSNQSRDMVFHLMLNTFCWLVMGFLMPLYLLGRRSRK